MKALISIFVLFFSFSSLAEDELAGKAVYCYREFKYSGALYAKAFGVKFISGNEAIIYFEENDEARSSLRGDYSTAAERIFINNSDGDRLILINRKNLIIETIKIIWGTGQCEISNTKELLKLFDDSFSKFREGNLL